VSLDKPFTVNMEGICGVTYRDPDTREITPIDIISPEVVSTRFMLLAVDRSHTLDI
jgi:hypothetical protein